MPKCSQQQSSQLESPPLDYPTNLVHPTLDHPNQDNSNLNHLTNLVHPVLDHPNWDRPNLDIRQWRRKIKIRERRVTRVESVVEVMKRMQKIKMELSGLSVSFARFWYHVHCQNVLDEWYFICDGCEESD
jgi:hypothetical protein